MSCPGTATLATTWLRGEIGVFKWNPGKIDDMYKHAHMYINVFKFSME